MIHLELYFNQQEQMIPLIKQFWLSHNQYNQSDHEAQEDLNVWTQPNHLLYFIQYQKEYVGFIHLGSRGAAIDWLEDIFVLPAYQKKGIASKAIQMIEEMVQEYSDSLYIEASARNEKAIRLYHHLGYSCLNTITIRKDFHPQDFNSIESTSIYNMDFDIKSKK